MLYTIDLPKVFLFLVSGICTILSRVLVLKKLPLPSGQNCSWEGKILQLSCTVSTTANDNRKALRKLQSWETSLELSQIYAYLKYPTKPVWHIMINHLFTLLKPCNIFDRLGCILSFLPLFQSFRCFSPLYGLNDYLQQLQLLTIVFALQEVVLCLERPREFLEDCCKRRKGKETNIKMSSVETALEGVFRAWDVQSLPAY